MRLRALLRALALALCLAACLPAPAGRAYPTVARVTYYVGAGVMANGEWTCPGAAACSYDLPLGATVSIRGLAFTCADRGLLFPGPWIDTYGDYGFADYEAIEVD